MKRLLLDRKKNVKPGIDHFRYDVERKFCIFQASHVIYFIRRNKGIPSQSLVYFKRLVCLEVPDRKQ